MALGQTYYSPSGNPEVWLEKPDGYFTPEQWDARVRDMQMTLEEAKAAKLAAIDSQTSAAILTGFDYTVNGENLHFSYDSFDQQNFADTANACLLAQSGAAGLPESVTWNAYQGSRADPRRAERNMSRLKALLIALDQLCNALLGGWPDETLSSRCWRWEMGGVRSWPRKFIDALAMLFGDRDHCRQSFESERTGRQLPPELR